MVVYHGTTDRRAGRIRAEGFLPRKPSRRVWFAKSRGYALSRAKTQARRGRARAVVLTCEINIGQLRVRFGAKRVFFRNGILAVSAPVPAAVVRSSPGAEDLPTSPAGLAAWVNDLLGLKAHKGVGRRDPGIQRLLDWIDKRRADQPRARIHRSELIRLARQWLPGFFAGIAIDPARLRCYRTASTASKAAIGAETAARAELPPEVLREQEALDCLAHPHPRRRVRGLRLLAEIADPDLFDWCAMCLADESTDVRAAALREILHCREVELELIVPLACSDDKRLRAAAIAALARHAGETAPFWFERALKDPSTCVRLATAALLPRLDPAAHRSVFELALHDPNPQIERLARGLTAGKGFAHAGRRHAAVSWKRTTTGGSRKRPYPSRA